MLVYATEYCPRTFDTDLALHLKHGIVISTESVFLMGRPVERNAEHRLIVNPAIRFYNPDCWLVYLAAGHIGRFFKYEPYRLPWFCWERSNRLKFYKRANVARLLGGGGTIRSAHARMCACQFRPPEQGRLHARPATPAQAGSADHCCREFAEAKSSGLDVPQAGICQYDPHERSWHSIERAIGS
jgi:hypothetical protein